MRKTPLIFIWILIACSAPAENPLILESAEIHQSTMKISEGVVGKIKKMNTLLDDLEEDQSYLKDSLSVLKQDFIDWESNLIEVPGYEQDLHDHEGHDHDHDHSPPPDLTPEMMLRIQKDLNAQIEQIDRRSQSLLEEFEGKGN